MSTNDIYKEPSSVFQVKVRDACKETTASDMVDVVLRLMLGFNESGSLSELYKLVGLTEFTKIIDLFSGMTVTFPDREDFKEYVTIAACYYYRKILGKSWKDIKKVLGEENIRAHKYSNKIKIFQRDLENILNGEVPDSWK